MAGRLSWSVFVCVVAVFSIASAANASPAKALEHVVSVLPMWPGHQQGGSGGTPGQAPEGSGIFLRNGVIVTAWHVIEPANRIDVRLSDGRVLPARLLAGDAATDIALLSVDADVAPIAIAPDVELAQRVCAIGNAFGLDLSVTCGIVSATSVTDAGFNDIEDFIQTDAAANPGSSGGALVDGEGRLVGMISAIFASSGDTNIGINFAVSTDLLVRVADALIGEGEVRYLQPGWQLERADRSQLAEIAAPVVKTVDSGGPAERAGIQAGDRIVAIGGRRVKDPRSANTAIALLPGDTEKTDVSIRRNGTSQSVNLSFALTAANETAVTDGLADPDCPHPAVVCDMRQAVFPISSFDPVGSATRIGGDLLVTNRHVVGNTGTATVHAPGGPREARVIPSAYRGDLILLQVDGLPDGGRIADMEIVSGDQSVFYTVGADVARKEIRVFDPGPLIALPAETAEFGRLHVGAHMQPGVSGGGLIDGAGQLTGIAVGGGDGRFEAIPIKDIKALLDLRSHADAVAITERLGAGFEACAETLESSETAGISDTEAAGLSEVCRSAENHGQLLKAGRMLAKAGHFEEAISLHGVAVQQVPNSINARMSLLVSLQLGGRFPEMTSHARQLMELAQGDPQALRFSIQSGVWGGDAALAEEGYAALLKADPRQAQAARRFIDAAPPAPPRR